jgi:riboflavin kinase/FMN adenylyltransferase
MTNYSDFYKNYIFSSLSVKNIIAGTNHAFGENRKGDNRLLTELCEENSVNLTTVPPVYYGDKTISSTRIRKSLAIGDVVDASHMLGYDYFITGKVIKGKGLGSLLGFSTANTDILNSEKVIPYKGVYFTTVEFGGKTYYAVSNIGENPTLGGTGLHMETHILGFKADLYGETIKVGFIKRLRDEISFSSAVELSEAVGRDIREGMRLEKTMRMPG